MPGDGDVATDGSVGGLLFLTSAGSVWPSLFVFNAAMPTCSACGGGNCVYGIGLHDMLTTCLTRVVCLHDFSPLQGSSTASGGSAEPDCWHVAHMSAAARVLKVG